MILTTLVNQLQKKIYKILLGATFLISLTFGWQINLLPGTNNAQAAVLSHPYQLIANLNNSGLQNQIEGRAQQDIGRTQSALDQAGNQMEKAVKRTSDKADALGKQVQGRAQQDIGKTQDALQDTGNQIEDTAENALDAVKNFFGQ